MCSLFFKGDAVSFSAAVVADVVPGLSVASGFVAADGSVVFYGFVVAGDVVVSDFVLLGGSSDADFGAITTA